MPLRNRGLYLPPTRSTPSDCYHSTAFWFFVSKPHSFSTLSLHVLCPLCCHVACPTTPHLFKRWLCEEFSLTYSRLQCMLLSWLMQPAGLLYHKFRFDQDIRVYIVNFSGPARWLESILIGTSFLTQMHSECKHIKPVKIAKFTSLTLLHLRIPFHSPYCKMLRSLTSKYSKGKCTGFVFYYYPMRIQKRIRDFD